MQLEAVMEYFLTATGEAVKSQHFSSLNTTLPATVSDKPLRMFESRTFERDLWHLEIYAKHLIKDSLLSACCCLVMEVTAEAVNG